MLPKLTISFQVIKNGSQSLNPCHRATRRQRTEDGLSRILLFQRQRIQPLPVRFEHLNLIVKFGPHVVIAEAQCLWVIKRVLLDLLKIVGQSCESLGWEWYSSTESGLLKPLSCCFDVYEDCDTMGRNYIRGVSGSSSRRTYLCYVLYRKWPASCDIWA